MRNTRSFTVDGPDCADCGHPRKSHRYGNPNPDAGTYLSKCRKHDCDCRQYDHPDLGPMR